MIHLRDESMTPARHRRESLSPALEAWANEDRATVAVSKFARQCGLTLLEAVFGFAGMVAVAAVGYSVTNATADLSQTTQENSLLTRKSAAAVERIASELYQSDSASLAIDADGAGVVFQRVRGLEDGALELENAKRVSLEDDPNDPEDNVDNDFDGLVDEKCVVLTINYDQAGEEQVILVHDVAEWAFGETLNGLDDNENGLIDERGLSVSLDGRKIEISMTVHHVRSDDRIMTRTAAFSFALRN